MAKCSSSSKSERKHEFLLVSHQNNVVVVTNVITLEKFNDFFLQKTTVFPSATKFLKLSAT